MGEERKMRNELKLQLEEAGPEKEEIIVSHKNEISALETRISELAS